MIFWSSDLDPILQCQSMGYNWMLKCGPPPQQAAWFYDHSTSCSEQPTIINSNPPQIYYKISVPCISFILKLRQTASFFFFPYKNILFWHILRRLAWPIQKKQCGKGHPWRTEGENKNESPTPAPRTAGLEISSDRQGF